MERALSSGNVTPKSKNQNFTGLDGRARVSRGTWIGMKHPLLSLCGPDILAAWGKQTHFIWTQRPLTKSIESLIKKSWWKSSEDGLRRLTELEIRTLYTAIQKRLWDKLEEFFRSQPHLGVDYSLMMNDSPRQLLRVCDYLGYKPTNAQFSEAVRHIMPTSRE